MNDNLLGSILLLSLLLGIVFIAGKGCRDHDKQFIQLGYTQQEYCSEYSTKWVKP